MSSGPAVSGADASSTSQYGRQPPPAGGPLHVRQVWTDWLRARTSVACLDGLSADVTAALCAMDTGFAKHRLITPTAVEPGWLDEESLRTLRLEAVQALTAPEAEINDDKVNASPTLLARSLCDEGVRRVAGEAVCTEISGLTDSTYIGYLTSRSKLELHLDAAEFSDITVMICLEAPVSRPSASSFTYFLDDRFCQVSLKPGAALIFDGAFLAHGRTPVAAGERAVLLAYGARVLGFAGGLERYRGVELPPRPREP